MTQNNRRPRTPSKTIFLPVGEALFFVTKTPENKWDANNLQWSGKIKYNSEERKAVEQLLGPLLPEALEAKKAELIAEAKGSLPNGGDDMVKMKLAEAMEYETPWREVIDRETGQPTGDIEIVVKRPALRMNRATKEKEPNSAPLVVDSQGKPTNSPVPNRARVIVKMATWPVYFPKDNVAGIKRLFEAVQIVSMPEAFRPTADGFGVIEGGYVADEANNSSQGASPVAGAGDY